MFLTFSIIVIFPMTLFSMTLFSIFTTDEHNYENLDVVIEE